MNKWERKKLYVVVACIGLAILYNVFYRPPEKLKIKDINASSKVSLKEKKPKGEKKLLVQVSGAVNKPGVYEMPEGIRIRDAIKIAGGFAPTANKSNVNLVKKIKDGMHIKIPRMKVKATKSQKQKIKQLKQKKKLKKEQNNGK